MPWTQVSDGRYERSLDPSEAFYTRLKALPCPPGRERWALTSVAQFKTDLPSESILPALRQAWKQLRYRCPVLAARLEYDKKIYEVPSDEIVEDWLDRTIVVEQEGADPEQIIATYNSCEECRLHYLPGSSQVVIRVNHWRTDGVGLCILTNKFFEMLANPEEVVFGDEGVWLSPSIEEVAGVCDVTEEKLKTVRQAFQRNQEKGRSVLVPVKGIGRPQGTHRQTRSFSEAATSAVVAACKARGVTVTTAAAAALVLTAQEFEVSEPSFQAERMLFNAWFNLRPHMPSPFVGKDHPLSSMIISDTISIELLEFEESIKQIAPFYAKDFALNSETGLIPLVGAKNQFLVESYQPPPSNSIAAAPAPTYSTHRAITPSLNSIGILDRYLEYSHQGSRKIEIEDFWFAVDILGPIMMTYLWTFRGKMCFSTYYNETSFDDEYVQSFTNTLAETLLEKLGVEE